MWTHPYNVLHLFTCVCMCVNGNHYYTPVAARVLSVPEHTIHGSKLLLQYARIPDQEESGKEYESNKLLIHQIPQVNQEHLQLFLDSTLDSQNDFIVEVKGGSAMITFLNVHFSNEGMILCVLCANYVENCNKVLHKKYLL